MSTTRPIGLFKSFLQTSKDSRYVPLYSYGEHGGAGQPNLTRPWERQWSTLLVVILVAASSITSAWMGYFVASRRFYHPEAKSEGMLMPYTLKTFAVLTLLDFLAASGNVKYSMTYNSTYSQGPSPKADAAWGSMFPCKNSLHRNRCLRLS